jgi:hypothetical protein
MERMPRPDACGPLGREFFAAAFAAAVDAARTPQHSPGTKRPAPRAVARKDAEGTTYYLTPSPLQRMFDALRASCGEEEMVYSSVVFRTFALLGILRSSALRPWVQASPPEDPNATLCHQAVLFAAAEVPLTKKGTFPIAAFVQKVQEIVAKDFPEDATSPRDTKRCGYTLP